MEDSEHSACEAIERYAQPSATFDKRTDRRNIAKLCETSKCFLRETLKDFFANSIPGGTVVRFHTSDGTLILRNKAFHEHVCFAQCLFWC
jgi:hypothetical protein